MRLQDREVYESSFGNTWRGKLSGVYVSLALMKHPTDAEA